MTSWLTAHLVVVVKSPTGNAYTGITSPSGSAYTTGINIDNLSVVFSVRHVKAAVVSAVHER